RRGMEPAALRKFLRGDLDWIVMKCLEKVRARRYETANSLAADIERHLKHEPVAAGPPSTLYMLKKFITRNIWPVAFMWPAAALAIAGLIGTSIGLHRATMARIRADENAARAERSAAVARAAEAGAFREAYSAKMQSASDALERGQMDAAKDYLDSAPKDL